VGTAIVFADILHIGGIDRMMRFDNLVQRFENKLRPPLPIFRVLNRAKEQFACPLCGYEGQFADFHSFAGARNMPFVRNAARLKGIACRT
jgi:hypothetical protein